MEHKKKVTIAIGLILAIAMSNLFLFFNKSGTISYNSISGRFITEDIQLPLNINFSNLMFYAQWFILAIIVLFLFVSVLKRKTEEKIRTASQIISLSKIKPETDLDVLYKLLKNQGKISIPTIAEKFKISKETAMVWAKILEEHDLAEIEYPTFADPILKTKEKEENVKEKNKKKIKEKILKAIKKEENEKKEKTKPQRHKKRIVP